jgi:hypothetical protein
MHNPEVFLYRFLDLQTGFTVVGHFLRLTFFPRWRTKVI